LHDTIGCNFSCLIWDKKELLDVDYYEGKHGKCDQERKVKEQKVSVQQNFNIASLQPSSTPKRGNTNLNLMSFEVGFKRFCHAADP
jgi:hypothetical protein